MDKNILYVFDLDDTLFWASEFYEKVIIDKNGCVKDPGNSYALKKALNFFKHTGLDDHLRLKMEKTSQPNGRDYYFEVVDIRFNSVLYTELALMSDLNELKKSGIKRNKKYSPYASIVSDNQYFEDPSTVGTIGKNDEIFSFYTEVHNKSIILTARKDTPGMKKRIKEVLLDYPPIDIYTQPLNSSGSGDFKAKILMKYLLDENIDKIYFYDDNIKYIEIIKEKLKKKDMLSDKIEIIKVSTDKKPLNMAKIAYSYGKILNKNPVLNDNNFLDKYIEELFSTK